MLSCNNYLFVRGNQIATFFNHFGAGYFPMLTSPMKAIRLPPTFDRDPKLPRTFGHGHGDISRVNITIRIMINRTLKVFGMDQRPFLFYLIRGHKNIGYTTGLSGRRI